MCSAPCAVPAQLLSILTAAEVSIRRCAADRCGSAATIPLRRDCHSKGAHLFTLTLRGLFAHTLSTLTRSPTLLPPPTHTEKVRPHQCATDWQAIGNNLFFIFLLYLSSVSFLLSFFFIFLLLSFFFSLLSFFSPLSLSLRRSGRGPALESATSVWVDL